MKKIYMCFVYLRQNNYVSCVVSVFILTKMSGEYDTSFRLIDLTFIHYYDTYYYSYIEPCFIKKGFYFICQLTWHAFLSFHTLI